MTLKIVNESKCSGCNLCALACSYYTAPGKSFNPAAAKIKITRKNELNRFEVIIKKECIDCGKCAEYCFYEVLAFA